MPTRYLIAVASDPGAAGLFHKPSGAVRDALSGSATLYDSNGVLAIAAGPHAPLGPDGILLGSLFMRGRNGRVALTDAEQRLAVASSGQWLVDQCWGGYIALLADPDAGAVQLLRAPLGDLPCYRTVLDGVALFASDMALLNAWTGARPPVDPAALAAHLAAPDLRTGRTCLGDIAEIQGGERLRLEKGRSTLDTLWSPWTFLARKPQVTDRAEASRYVRDAALHCVAARAAEHRRVLLMLSGGLDSSVVASALASAGKDFCALNLVTEDPLGDERGYARTVADHFGAPLFERIRDPRGVDLMTSAAARLPRPTARAFTQESRRAAALAAADIVADALFDGGGGDNLFCSLQSARPAADCLMTGSGSGHFWATATAIAVLAQASLCMVAARAWAIGRRSSPAYAWHVDRRFLTPDAAAAAEGANEHPWLAAPDSALPGKAAHVALIAAAQSVAEGVDAEDPMPACSPLISQPLAEACLLVPSWMWFGPVGNRAIAREAFAPYLPPGIAQRRSKGAPDSFIAELFEHNVPLLRALLLEGNLRRLHLIDGAAAEAALARQGPLLGHDYLRIMQLADAEVWTRCWT